MDKINNNNNNFIASFSGIKRNKPAMLDKTAKMNILVPKSKEVLLGIAERAVPENGQFKKVFVSFRIPESQNEALLTIEHDSKEPKTQRLLSIGVHHQNSDRLISNFLLRGTKKEILTYLKDDKNSKIIIDYVNHLSDKVDESYSSL